MGFSRQEYWSGLPFPSVLFSRSVMTDSWRPHESQHTRPPSPSPTPGVHSDSRPSNQWCHSAISSSVVPFSSCPQSLPASESFPMSQLFKWGGPSTGVSALTSYYSATKKEIMPFAATWAKAFDCVDHNTPEEMGISDHLTCLLRNLYAGQEATVRTGHGTTDWLQIGKGVHQGCILSPCL